MPANDVDRNLNAEELRPPASVLRMLAFVRSRGAGMSTPDAGGAVTTMGIGSGGRAAEALAQSLTSRSLKPLTLGSPDWLIALFNRHRFASWSQGLPNLYYFHWLRSVAEESATDSPERVSYAPSSRSSVGRSPLIGTQSASAASATLSPRITTGGPSWATNTPTVFPSTDFALARRRRVDAEEDAPSTQRSASVPSFDAPRSIPLLPGTLNASSVLSPMLTLHNETAQGRSAAWTDATLMQFARPEAMAQEVIQRAETPSRRSNEPAPERAVGSPYMPVSYPPVPLASWLGVAASAPEKAYWESAPGFARAEFSPASSHLLALSNLVADVRTQPVFERQSAAAFAALPRLASTKTSAQVAGEAADAVQRAQSVATRPNRLSWPASPIMAAGIGPTVQPSVSAERQPREPSTPAAAEEPAAARRSPLAAARTALEVVQRVGAQAAQTLRSLVFLPSDAPQPAATEAAQLSASFFAVLPSRFPLPRLRRTTEPGEPSPPTAEPTFYGIPSAYGPVLRQTADSGTAATIFPSPGAAAPVLLEQLVAERHQPLTARAARSASPLLGVDPQDRTHVWPDARTVFADLPLPLVARARRTEQQAETGVPAFPTGRAVSLASQAATASSLSQSTSEAAATQTGQAKPSPFASIAETVLSRTAALLGSLASSNVGRMAPAPASTEASVFGTPFASVQSFSGQFTLPRRRDLPAPETQPTGYAPSITGMAAVPSLRRPGMPTSGAAAEVASAFGPATPTETVLPQRPRTQGARETLVVDATTTSRPSVVQPGIASVRQSALHPFDFSAGVTARYVEPIGEQPSGTDLRPRSQATPKNRAVAPDLLAVPSAIAPLLRFLRFSQIRGLDTPVAGYRSTASGDLSPATFGRSGVTVPAPTAEAGMPASLSRPSPLTAPLLRLLRLGELRPTEIDPFWPAQTADEFVPPGSRATRLATQRPQEFSADVTARYVEAIGETPPRQSPSRVSTPQETSTAPMQPALSSVIAPLLRFLRLADFRRADAAPDEFTSSAPIDLPTVASHRAQGRGDSAQYRQNETLQPRILSGSVSSPSAIPAAAPVSMLSSLTAPLLRFLRLGELRQAESERAEFAPEAGSVFTPVLADRPIFGGIPTSILSPASALRVSAGERTETPAQRYWTFAAPFSSLRLPSLQRRSAAETVRGGGTAWSKAADSVSRTSPTGVARPEEADVFDMPTVTVLPRVLGHRTESGTTAGSVSQAPGLIGRFFLPKRPAAEAPADRLPMGLGFESAAPTFAARPGRPAFSPDGPSFARRRTSGLVAGGRASEDAAFAESETATGAFQAQLFGPIRDFLLSTLSRILSPMEAIGQIPETWQPPTDEPGRELRSGVSPNLVWWSAATDASIEEAMEGQSSWGIPAFPTIERPTLSQFSFLAEGQTEGMGSQRRLALEASRRSEFARPGFQALRMAMEQRTRSLIGRDGPRPATETDGTVPTETRPAAFLPRSGRRLPTRPDAAAPSPAVQRSDGAGTLSPTEFLDTMGFRPLRLVLPRTDQFLPSETTGEGTDDAPIRGGDRPLGQTLTSLPSRRDGPEPTRVAPEPAWMGGRSGSALAERVPTMPLPMRGDRQSAAATLTTQDPYVIQQARTGTAVATPTPQSSSSADDHSESAHQDGGQGDVQAMATEVWTVLRRRLALEAARAGNR